MARSFVASSFQGFLSTALIMPFEVGKTLAQVQWVPRDGIDPMTWGGNQDVVEEEVVEVSWSFVDGECSEGQPGCTSARAWTEGR